MRSWTATLVFLLHLALSLPNGSGQVSKSPSDLPTIPAGPEDVKYVVLIPAGYGLKFVINSSKPPQKPSAVAAPIPRQQTAQEPPASEVPKPATKAQAQPVAPDTDSGVPLAERPIQPQVPLTPTEARERAQALLGESPDRVQIYFDEEKLNYLAFNIQAEPTFIEAEKKWKQGRDQVWLYGENPDSHLLQQVWYDRKFWPELNQWELEDFVRVRGQKGPCLRIKGRWAGNHVSGDRVGMYCVDNGRLFWVDYYIDDGFSGLPRVATRDESASNAEVRTYLTSWAHDLRLDVTSRWNLQVGKRSRLEQSWLDANGRQPCPSEWPGSPSQEWKHSLTDKMLPYTDEFGGRPQVALADGRYQWVSYFKGPVGVHDSETGQSFLVYVPNHTACWSDKLVVIGPWLYIQDCIGHWAARLNKNTHRLERDDFDAVVASLDTGVYPATHSGNSAATVRTENKDATVPLIHPYDLVQNPFAYRAREVRLDVGSWPYMLNGQVYRWSPMAGGTMRGIQFQRMLTENEALYDVMGLDMKDASSGLRTIGQLLVLVPNPRPQPHPGSVWLVRPLGVETGTNYFGAVIQTPKVQFLRYTDE